ncbi:hypothetical protein [Salegentibacter sp. Hel_I_6]|uniref:hypothetical protein n=1 Tax=Salegentibacter sp. Hel_I_6 TaxID=1250278 RepID=UPI00055B13E7|nr:hypothetical protein [Salegentibacter sp. Hel_I_6]
MMKARHNSVKHLIVVYKEGLLVTTIGVDGNKWIYTLRIKTKTTIEGSPKEFLKNTMIFQKFVPVIFYFQYIPTRKPISTSVKSLKR